MECFFLVLVQLEDLHLLRYNRLRTFKTMKKEVFFYG
jgi:hypothetical protein